MKRYVCFAAALLIAASASAQVVGGGPVIGGGGASGGTGDVVGPASATDNSIVRFDSTTGKLVQNSAVSILDRGNIIATVTAPESAVTFSVVSDGENIWDMQRGAASSYGVTRIITGGASGALNWYYGTAPDGASVDGDFSLYDYNGAAYRLVIRDGSGDESIPAAAQRVWGATTAQSAPDTGLARGAAGIVDITNGSTGAGALHLRPMASPPRTCDATAEGDIYSDTSHALCFCDGTSWNVLTGSGAGSCA